MPDSPGEILELNPNYKAPPDYKPLLKEAIVPIPPLQVKKYRGYNFLGLIFGPANDTRKRVEKETGTVIRVYGTKADMGEKVEISTSDGNVQDAHEELYINISAEIREKVDAAADLIELLVTSVSGSLAAISTPTLVPGQMSMFLVKARVPNAVVNPGVALAVGLIQTPSQDQFQNKIPWFPSSPSQNPMHPMNSLAPILTNPINMPSLFGPRPGAAAGRPSNLQLFPLVLCPKCKLWHAHICHRSILVARETYLCQLHSLLQFDLTPVRHFTGIQPQPIGPFATGKLAMPSLPQSVSSIPP